MSGPDETPSARAQELLELAYAYALEHGLADLSLRPLAAAVGSSPRVLLYLFGSKDALVRALLARARQEELAMLAALRTNEGPPETRLARAAEGVWVWLARPEHRALLALWVEGYGRSLVDAEGPWAGYARSTVDDWLAVFARAQPPAVRRSARGRAERTLALAVLRGALLDLVATGEADRITAAVRLHLAGTSRAEGAERSEVDGHLVR
jgi:AcrR family transcriptional regulator